MEQDETATKVWVVCSVCGQEHRLLPGVGAPVYWCGNELESLKEGDDVVYEETET